MKTEICERLGIEFPIFAFSHCRDVVAAVSRAGGLGVLGAVAYSPEQLELELNWIDEHIDGLPYGVDLIAPTSLAATDDDTGDTLKARVPDEHRDYAINVLAQHDIDAGDVYDSRCLWERKLSDVANEEGFCWLAIIDDESANARSAWNFAAETGQFTQIDRGVSSSATSSASVSVPVNPSSRIMPTASAFTS